MRIVRVDNCAGRWDNSRHFAVSTSIGVSLGLIGTTVFLSRWVRRPCDHRSFEKHGRSLLEPGDMKGDVLNLGPFLEIDER